MKIRLHHHLTGLVFITLVPVILYTAAIVVYLADQRSKVLETNVISTSRALVSAVDKNISTMVSSLRILSESEGFEADTVQFLHKRLRQVVKEQPDWDHISFVDTSGSQIFNTNEPFGKKLPRLNEESYFKKMIETGEPVISGFQKSGGITVSVPVIKDKHIIYALVGSIKLSAFDRLLKEQNLPGKWTAGIIDQDKTYIAHSRNPERFTGQQASEKLTEKTKGRGDYGFTYENNDGSESFGALANSKIVNWKIFIRIPDDGHLFTSWRTIWLFVIGGIILLGINSLFAIFVARKISAPLGALSLSAKNLGDGKKINDIRTNLPEVTEVNEALKAAARTRDENERRIQEAVNVRDTFLSVASHELKSPITTLKLQIQILNRTRATTDMDKSMKRFENQINRLNSLVNELLDVTRISSGKLSFEPETFDLIPLLDETIQGIEHSHLITIKAPERLIGHWDKHRLVQVILNLSSNAIKYGDGNPVTVTLAETSGKAILEVADRGIGMTREDAKKIFDRFERVGNHPGISGLGLGLWIVKKILEGMNGEITVKSSPGVGSTFRIELPIGLNREESINSPLFLDSLPRQ